MKNKNIVLCSDGTGNKGGYGADTNVYKTYKAVDVSSPDVYQYTFYDQGVGTDKSEHSKNKYRKALSGAFGFGFRANVLHLYHFLARCYHPGDAIFLFGFSRGAATIRAFTGFVHACGLVDIRQATENGVFDSVKFKALVEEAFVCYRSQDKAAQQAFKARYAVQDDVHAPGGDLKIKFVGVWDTVSALGFPQDFSVVVSWPFRWLEKASNHVCFKIPLIDYEICWKHDFYDYELNPSIENAYQALSMDDERQTFHPLVWNEQGFDNYVEQVWFAGVHSNVGGGYPRTGLSDTALRWMWHKAAAHGLVLYQDHIDEIEESANVYDKLYDSRDGVAVYYRYGPRNLVELCADKLKGKIAVHYSAYRKIKEFSEGYAPDGLPSAFDVVDVDDRDPAKQRVIRSVEAEPAEKWLQLDNEAKQVIARRKGVYRVFVELTMAILLVSGIFWKNPPVSVSDLNTCEIEHVQIAQMPANGQTACNAGELTDAAFVSFQQKRHDLFEPGELANCSTPVEPEFCRIAADRPLKLLGDFLRYVTPVYFDNFITFVVEAHSWMAVLMLAVLFQLMNTRNKLVNRLDRICREMTDLFPGR
ncbi:DUF2235 domain-containing protein [Methylomonas sp. MgM2]